MLFDGHRPNSIEGSGVLTCIFRNIPLLPQTYSVRMGIRAENGVTFLLRTEEVGFFTVAGPGHALGWRGQRVDALMGSAAPVFMPYEWKLPDGRTLAVIPEWLKIHEKMLPNPED